MKNKAISFLDYKFWTSGNTSSVIETSLIICTYKRPDTLLKLFESLINMEDLPDEILIIDGSQDNNSYDILSPFLKENNFGRDIYYIFSPTGLTIQRNAGIDISNGQIVHFLDDDCIPEKGYFKAIEEIFKQQKDVGGVTGNILNEIVIPVSLKYKIRCFLGIYSKHNLPGKYYCNGSSVPKGLLSELKENTEVDIASGASMSFRKSILNDAGDFSEFFSGYSQGEDLEASLRIRRISKIIRCSEAKCNHYTEQSSRPDLFKKGFMEVYNRYYIWKLNTLQLKLKCKLQFWGDIAFLHIYSLLLFFLSGFKIAYWRYFIGYLSGTLKAIKTRNVVEVERTIRFKLQINEKLQIQ